MKKNSFEYIKSINWNEKMSRPKVIKDNTYFEAKTFFCIVCSMKPFLSSVK